VAPPDPSLLALGAGFGLFAVSPWSNVGASASTVSTAAIVWLIFIEIIASVLGGYLTGRLRTKWALIHTDEVYFRDTANGFLAWAVALVISTTLLASAAASMVGRVAQLGAAAETAGTASSAMILTGTLWIHYFVPIMSDRKARMRLGRLKPDVFLTTPFGTSGFPPRSKIT
jgi:hypothetical protein